MESSWTGTPAAGEHLEVANNAALLASFDDLSDHVQDHARKAYSQFQNDPAHPGLQFKRVSMAEPLYSARVGILHRAVGLLDGDTVTWFWIGSHDEYERLLNG